MRLAYVRINIEVCDERVVCGNRQSGHWTLHQEFMQQKKIVLLKP